ncbi:hypothetical protein [Desulfotalea psychrophila]|uniref:Conjugal transfer protein TraB n=1 Tax=Desulfotalea psychrophila (strain LSv54 / DSM 12343) TaxID=177439 RepID=Q6AJ22_DESPS|nr:hypothetical protein [Desulfotalea psychrophila]CAG37658.1 unknown protein [Desulfotalea psychrophila LSv54]
MAPPENTKDTPVSEELLLKISKEIIIKFIEVGRVTPATFGESFTNIHNSIRKSAQR